MLQQLAFVHLRSLLALGPVRLIGSVFLVHQHGTRLSTANLIQTTPTALKAKIIECIIFMIYSTPARARHILPYSAADTYRHSLESSAMYILVIMDPIELQQPDKDTTIGFILAAQHQGHQIDYAQLHDLFIQNGQAGVSSQAIELSLSSHPFYELGSVQTRRLCDYDTIWMRKDPPVDRAYLHATHILDSPGPIHLL